MPKDSSPSSNTNSKYGTNPYQKRVDSAKRYRRHRSSLRVVVRRKAIREVETGRSSGGSLIEAFRSIAASSARDIHGSFAFDFDQFAKNLILESNDIESRRGPLTDIERDSRPTRLLPSLPVQRGCDIYHRHQVMKGRGTPIWLPEPSSTLPSAFRRRGVAVGDVIILTDSGGFDFMFNVCLPADHPINQEGVPEGFSPLSPQLRSSDIQRHMEFKPNNYLASPSIGESGREKDSSWRGFSFESSASEGAILIMPQGAHAEDLANFSGMRRYAIDNVESWYRYINNTRGREARNGDVRLVIGCDKASSWGISTFAHSTAHNFHLKFRPTGENGTHGWEYSGNVNVRAGPAPEQTEELRSSDDSGHSDSYNNQCLFVRTMNLMLSDDIWQKLGLDTDTEIETAIDIQYPDGWPSSGIAQNPLPPVHITSFNTTFAAHPSKTLNMCLLTANPRARIAITEDKDWTSLISKCDQRLPPPEELIKRMLITHNVCEADGLVSLKFRQGPTKVPYYLNNLGNPLQELEASTHEDVVASKGKLCTVNTAGQLILDHDIAPAIPALQFALLPLLKEESPDATLSHSLHALTFTLNPSHSHSDSIANGG